MKTRFSKYLSLLILGFSLVSCVDVIELDLPEGEKFLVVEGWITNQPGPHHVTLTYTAAYFSDDPTPPAVGAVVSLNDDLGNSWILTETAPGIYSYPDSGIIGRTYILKIALSDGTLYESAPELLHEPVLIQSVYWQLADKEPDPDYDEEPDDIYSVLIDTQEPSGLGNYYQWRQFKNGVRFQDPFDIFATSDEFVDGNPIIGFDVLERKFAALDTVVVVQEQISRAAYEYLNAIQRLTAYVGSPFDSPPAPVESNVKNLSDPKRIALGFFGASGTDEKSVVVGVE